MTVRKAVVTLATVHVRPVLAVLTRAVLERSEGGERREFRPRDGERRGGGGDRWKAAAMSVLRVVTLVTVRKTVVLVAKPPPLEGGERREYQPRDGEAPWWRSPARPRLW